MIIDMLAMLFTSVLPLGPRIRISARSRKWIFQPHSNLKPKATNYSSSTVKQRVGIQVLFFKVGESEYDLYMRVDTNTNGHRQWFYFSVKNLMPGTVRFNIYRFKKKFSLFQRGMKPYVRSRKSKEGWKPATGKVFYRMERQNADCSGSAQSATYYLTFEYKFEQAEDEVYFASGIPYTVSYLSQRLQTFTEAKKQLIEFEVSSAGTTLCGQDLKMITIEPKQKKSTLNYIIINARTHAGETSSSWVLDGLLEKIVQDENMHIWMEQNSISFKIMPMLNPDGVFVGNYRTGIIGQDFNRKFASDKKQLFPQITAIRKIVSECKKLGKVLLFLDLHGHSVLKNSFIYGPIQSLFVNHPLRNLPFAIWHNSKYFRLSSCKFKFNKDMGETARVYFQLKENILSYTCQISLGLYHQVSNTIQMLEDDYKSLGASIVLSMLEQLNQVKMAQFLRIQEITQKMPESSPLQSMKPITKQLTNRHQSRQSQLKSVIRKDKERLTCIEKINNIKKQLSMQKMNARPQKLSISPEKPKRCTTNNSLKKNINLEIDVHDDQKQKLRRQSNKNSKISLLPTRKSTFDKLELENDLATDEDQSPVKILKIDQKKQNRQAQFKIRRKSDMLKLLPESIRKKLGPKIELGFASTKYLANEPEIDYKFERSVTYDTPSLNTQIDQVLNTENQMSLADLQIINQKFSEEYQSINDSDNSSDDLQYKQKQYLMEFIKNKKASKVNETDDNLDDNAETEQPGCANTTTTVNINGFKQIRFKHIEEVAMKTMLPIRGSKRQAHKFKEMAHRSLGRAQLQDQYNIMPQMIQRKQLNERVNKKNVREPYFLVQIKNKMF